MCQPASAVKGVCGQWLFVSQRDSKVASSLNMEFVSNMQTHT